MTSCVGCDVTVVDPVKAVACPACAAIVARVMRALLDPTVETARLPTVPGRSTPPVEVDDDPGSYADGVKAIAEMTGRSARWIGATARRHDDPLPVLMVGGVMRLYVRDWNAWVRRRTERAPQAVEPGGRFGMLVVVKEQHGGSWECRCDCGAVRFYTSYNLAGGYRRSCGCASSTPSQAPAEPPSNGHPRKFVDLTGNRYGKLVVQRREGKHPGSGALTWLCACDCGKTKTVTGYNLKSGNTSSCGCLKRDRSEATRQRIADGLRRRTEARAEHDREVAEREAEQRAASPVGDVVEGWDDVARMCGRTVQWCSYMASEQVALPLPVVRDGERVTLSRDAYDAWRREMGAANRGDRELPRLSEISR